MVVDSEVYQNEIFLLQDILNHALIRFMSMLKLFLVGILAVLFFRFRILLQLPEELKKI